MAGIDEAQESSTIIAGGHGSALCSQRNEEPQSSRHGSADRDSIRTLRVAPLAFHI